jgi:hypothetical protein
MVHATDRLVSLRHADRFEPKYPVYNKTVVYRASDAIVTMAFTGIAFIDGIPTDEWIASTLAGCRFEHAIGMSFGQEFDLLNLGQAVSRLAHSLNRVLRRRADEEPLALIIAGARRKKGRWRRVAVSIERSAAGRFEARHFRWETRRQWQSRLLVGPRGWLSPAAAQARANELSASRSVADVERVVDAIVTEAARANPTAVGKDITGITLLPLVSPTLRVVYLHRSDESTFEGFTPLMLGRRTVHLPAAVTGPVATSLDGVQIQWRPVGLCDAPAGREAPVTNGLVFSFRAHPDREHL